MTDAIPSTAAPARTFPQANLPLGAFLGAAVAFASFAMPTDVFSGLVEWSGLPLILDAAEPPLGTTARFVFVAAAGIVAFAIGWAVLAGIDALEAQRARREAARSLAPHEPPRIRRADAHPDAPSRRPIFAEQDFGAATIVPASHAEEQREEQAEAARAFPAFLSPEHPEADAVSPDDTLVLGTEHIAPVERDEEAEEEATEQQSAEMPVVQPEAKVEAEAPSETQPDSSPASISSLMERLEGGLSSKVRRTPKSTPKPVQPAKPFGKHGPSADSSHRLRSALTDLQKLTGRP